MRGVTPFLCATISLIVFSSTPVDAESCKLGGSWKLVAFYAEDVATKARVHTYGERPSGYMTVTCDGRFSARAGTALTEPVLSIWEDVARTLIEPAGLVSGVYYWGTYRLDGNKIILRNEEARNTGWTIHDPTDLMWNEVKGTSKNGAIGRGLSDGAGF